jgi:hypothetical protein
MTRPKLNLDLAAPKPTAEPAPPRGKSQGRPDRIGKKAIIGYYPRETWAALHHLAIQQDKTAQDLVQEALDDLFAKYRSRG